LVDLRLKSPRESRRGDLLNFPRIVAKLSGGLRLSDVFLKSPAKLAETIRWACFLNCPRNVAKLSGALLSMRFPGLWDFGWVFSDHRRRRSSPVGRRQDSSARELEYECRYLVSTGLTIFNLTPYPGFINAIVRFEVLGSS
jgi:hypothetical protein